MCRVTWDLEGGSIATGHRQMCAQARSGKFHVREGRTTHRTVFQLTSHCHLQGHMSKPKGPFHLISTSWPWPTKLTPCPLAVYDSSTQTS